jgi:hypothetical protein
MTTRAFNVFGDGLKADVDMKPQAELDDMTDVEYSNERRRVRLACKAKAQTENDFETVKENYRDYRKKAERYMRARDRHLADFQARKTKAEEGRSEQVTKLKKIISKLESRGPCATLEEYKEAYLKANQTAGSVDAVVRRETIRRVNSTTFSSVLQREPSYGVIPKSTSSYRKVRSIHTK